MSRTAHRGRAPEAKTVPKCCTNVSVRSTSMRKHQQPYNSGSEEVEADLRLAHYVEGAFGSLRSPTRASRGRPPRRCLPRRRSDVDDARTAASKPRTACPWDSRRTLVGAEHCLRPNMHHVERQATILDNFISKAGVHRRGLHGGGGGASPPAATPGDSSGRQLRPRPVRSSDAAAQPADGNAWPTGRR
jgi:hypothetical protein